MKKYNITVNGKTYEVEVEEIGGNIASSMSTPAPKTDATSVKKETAQPKPASKPKTTTPKAPAGGIKVDAPMPGTIISIKAKPGDKVEKGDVIMILEAMKMENEILAPEAGTIATIDVVEGASVDTGVLLATLQ